ncbi:Protein of uncharacterised function (DUF330) [Serratia fonticola]|uniref:Protein of uncharacterized function (DUF330) n=1 Tax=Serratia fonticola TaxID=47917 RepID=A0A4U9UYH0_SERFO|nr:Protein of uncharacterised function (DUF330) [Serratia fonticola]
MKKWIPVVLALLLSACSSTPNKTYYQLPALGTPAQVSGTQASRQLWLEHVSVADFLAQSGVVYQTNDVQFVIGQKQPVGQPVGSAIAADVGDQPGQRFAGLGGVITADEQRSGCA